MKNHAFQFRETMLAELMVKLFCAKPHFDAEAKSIEKGLGTNHELRLLSTLPRFVAEAIGIGVRLGTKYSVKFDWNYYWTRRNCFTRNGWKTFHFET